MVHFTFATRNIYLDMYAEFKVLSLEYVYQMADFVFLVNMPAAVREIAHSNHD